jgi:hypothetical protein
VVESGTYVRIGVQVIFVGCGFIVADETLLKYRCDGIQKFGCDP